MTERICIKAYNQSETADLFTYLRKLDCPIDFRMWIIEEEPLWPEDTTPSNPLDFSADLEEPEYEIIDETLWTTKRTTNRKEKNYDGIL